MDKEIKKSTAGQEKLATEAQIKLIKELYEETHYKHQYTSDMLAYLTREEANKHINFLKETKVRDAQLRSQFPQNKGFDKIAFGLVYKLCRRSVKSNTEGLPPEYLNFKAWVNAEYKLFKECQKYSRKQVEEGGHQ